MMATLRGIGIVGFATAVTTVFLGWWAVPIVGLGWASQRGVRRPLFETAAGAVLGWAVLLGLNAASGDVSLVAERVGGVFGLSGAGLIVVTLTWAGLLAGAAAVLGRGVLNRSAGSAASLILWASLTGAEPLEAQGSLDAAIRAEVARYVAAVNSGDARAVAELYARTAAATSAGDGEVTRGWTAIRALLGTFQAALGTVAMTADSIAVTPVSDRGAVAVFLYTWTGRRGAETFRTEGAMTIVYERTVDGWRVVHDHTSTRAGAPREAPADPEPAPRPSSPALALSRPIRETEPCTVERVADGDTFECRGGPRVRLIGIDTPELSQQPFGHQAREVLEALVPPGTEVLLERDVELTDQYGRRLAYVWRGDVFVNWQMVRGGWATLLTFPPNVQYVEHFEAAQRLAREGRTGLWATGGFDCLPGDRRRGRC